MMELVDKDIEAVILILLHMLKKLEEWLDIEKMWKMTQIKFLEMKTTMSELTKYWMRLDITEENCNKFEDIAIEYINTINCRVCHILVRNKFCLPLVKIF